MTPCRNIKRFRQMRHYQKDSDFGFIMVINENFFQYDQIFERNEAICVKTNITEKFIKIG